MKSLLILILLFGFQHEVLAKKSKVAKMSAYEWSYAKNVFERFLSCERKISDANQDALTLCFNQYITKEAQDRGSQFKFLFKEKIKFTKIEKCNPSRTELIRDLENSAYELYLCFSTDYSGREKIGTVFFRSEKNDLKISLIKL